MSSDLEAEVHQLKAYLLEVAAQPEWRGWLKAAAVLAPHSGPNQRRGEDPYRYESRIALWGTREQWDQLGYTVQPKAKPRMAPDEAGQDWETVYSEQEVSGGEAAAALRPPRGVKYTARASSERAGIDPSGALAALELLLHAEGWRVYRRPDDRGAESYCDLAKKIVWVQRSGDSWRDFHRMAHETGHALIHQPEATRPAEWAGEIEAEAVAMLLGQMLGVGIAKETAGYMLYRSAGRQGAQEGFQIEEMAFSVRVVGAVETALETIWDLRAERRAMQSSMQDSDFESA